MYYFQYNPYLFQPFYPQGEIQPQKLPFFGNKIQEESREICNQQVVPQTSVIKIQVKEEDISEPKAIQIIPKKTPKKSKKTKDQQYDPEQLEQVKQRKYKQLENRNIVPNLIRSMLTFLNQKRRSSELTKKLVNNKNATSKQVYNLNKFYQYQKIIRNKIGNYVNEKTLQIFKDIHEEILQVFPLQQQEFYNMVSRMLLRYYLMEDIKLNIVGSQRMTSTMKKHNLESIRLLQQRLASHMQP